MRDIKIINRKHQYHDDAYDFSGSSHILIEDGFAMTMDDTFALYGGGGGAGRDGAGAPRGIEDLVVKGFVNYSYTSALAVGYGSAPPVKHLRFEDVPFISTHNKFAVWIQLTPAYSTGRGYASGSGSSRSAVLDDFQFVNCSFENDGGHIYIDGGENALTNFVFENCTFHAPLSLPVQYARAHILGLPRRALGSRTERPRVSRRAPCLASLRAARCYRESARRRSAGRQLGREDYLMVRFGVREGL